MGAPCLEIRRRPVVWGGGQLGDESARNPRELKIHERRWEMNDERTIRRRYEDAYAVSGALIAQGSALKGLSYLLGGGVIFLGFIASLALASESRSAPAALVGLFFSGVLASVVSGPLYAAGMLIAAQGQLLQAVLDTAVHTSPLLSLEQKGELLRLRATQPAQAPSATGAPEGPAQVPCPRCGAPVYVTARMCPNCWQPLRS